MVARTETKYEANSGTIHRILLTPDFAAAAGTPPEGAVNSKIRPKVSKTDREFGIRPRGVTLSRTIGTAPDTFKKYAFLVVLTATDWNSAAYAPEAEITIGSLTYKVVNQVDEDF